MSTNARITAWVAIGMAASLAFAEMQSIPKDQIDPQKVYWGVATGFEKAGEIDYDKIIKATPEYKELKKSKVERGTGKYWILMSQASDRTTRAIAQVGQDTEYDLIAAHGYLGSLKPPIAADDITDLILKQLDGDVAKEEETKK